MLFLLVMLGVNLNSLLCDNGLYTAILEYTSNKVIKNKYQ